MFDTNKELSFSFNGTETSLLPYSLGLEQESIPKYKQSVNFQDLLRMMQWSSSGLSAKTFLKRRGMISSIGTDIVVGTSFFAWPVPFNLNYSLTTAENGRIFNKKVVSEERFGTIVVEMSDYYDLPYSADIISYNWESSCYNSFGEVVSPPNISINENRVLFSKKIFGILRIQLRVKGYKYSVEYTFEKTKAEIQKIKTWFYEQSELSYSNVNLSIIGTYVNEENVEQQEILTIELDQSIEDVLGQCADGTLFRSWCSDANPEQEIEVIYHYYSTCTGEILDTIRITTKQCET